MRPPLPTPSRLAPPSCGAVAAPCDAHARRSRRSRAARTRTGPSPWRPDAGRVCAVVCATAGDGGRASRCLLVTRGGMRSQTAAATRAALCAWVHLLPGPGPRHPGRSRQKSHSADGLCASDKRADPGPGARARVTRGVMLILVMTGLSGGACPISESDCLTLRRGGAVWWQGRRGRGAYTAFAPPTGT